MKTTQEFLFNIITEDQYQEYEQEMNNLDDRKFLTQVFYPIDVIDITNNTEHTQHLSEKESFERLTKSLQDVTTYISIGENNARIRHSSLIKNHCNQLIDDNNFDNTTISSTFEYEKYPVKDKRVDTPKPLTKWVTYINNPTYSAYIVTRYLDHRVELGINE